MSLSIQISPTPSNNSLTLSFSTLKFQINTGVHVNRFSKGKIKTSKISNIFFTEPTWENWAGFSDFTYHLNSCNVKTLSIYGPMGLVNLCQTLRYHLWLPGMQLNCQEVGVSQIELESKDGLVLVRSVLVEGTSDGVQAELMPDALYLNRCMRKIKKGQDVEYWESEIVRVNKAVEGGTEEVHDNELIYREFDLGRNTVENYFLKYRATSSIVSYVVVQPDIPPKFDARKAKSFGIPPGPLFGKLSNGIEVEFEGNIIYPEDCMSGELKKGPVSIIICCPNEEYLESLTTQPEWDAYYAENSDRQVQNIVHLTPERIVQTDIYKEWISRFGNPRNIMLHEDYSFPSHIYDKSDNFINIISRADPLDFPDTESHSTKMAARQYSGLNNAFIGDGLMTFSETKGKPSISTPQIEELKFNFEDETIKQTLADYQALNSDQIDFNDPNFAIYFLGTSSADSSPVRNETGILLRINNFYLLLDCGSGTYGQIRRIFKEETESVMENLKCIWISHYHPDHCQGLLTVLKARKKFEEKLLLIGPPKVKGYLNEFSLISGKMNMEYLLNEELLTEEHSKQDFFLKQYNIDQFWNIPVIHCPDAHGLILRTTFGYKIVFSGDTRPCDTLIEAARDATILIHEATFEHEDLDQAIERRHTTIQEALNILEKTNAYRIILTHFSLRQRNIPINDFLSNSLPYNQVIIAMDLLQVNFRNLSKLPSKFKYLERVNELQ